MLWQANAIAASDAFYLPPGDARQSTIDVRDIAEITARVLTEDGHENKTYDLTSPESLGFAEVAEIIGEIPDKPVTYVPVSVADAEAAMRDQGVRPWSAHALAEIQGVFATGAYDEVPPDTRRLLGRPPIGSRQFATDHASAFTGN